MALSLDEWYLRKWPKAIEDEHRNGGNSGDGGVEEETRSFPRFKKLPIELRCLIWTFALPRSRIVFLKQSLLETKMYWNRIPSNLAIDATDDDIKSRGMYVDGRVTYFERIGSYRREIEVGYKGRPRAIKFTSQTPAPALLFVCLESFQVTSKIFTKAFGTYHSLPETWFDFEKDTLVLDFEVNGEIDFAPDELTQGECAKVKNLAIVNTDAFGRGQDGAYWLTGILPSFPNVKKAFVVDWGNCEPPTDTSDLKLIESIDVIAGLKLYDLDFSLIKDRTDLLWLGAKIDFNYDQDLHYYKYLVKRRELEEGLHAGNRTARLPQGYTLPDVRNATAITTSMITLMKEARGGFVERLRESDLAEIGTVFKNMALTES